MLVEGGYLHSMKQLIEKASAADVVPSHKPRRAAWHPTTILVTLFGSRRSPAVDPERPNMPRDARKQQ